LRAHAAVTGILLASFGYLFEVLLIDMMRYFELLTGTLERDLNLSRSYSLLNLNRWLLVVLII
jgi:hypothetical protein